MNPLAAILHRALWSATRPRAAFLTRCVEARLAIFRKTLVESGAGLRRIIVFGALAIAAPLTPGSAQQPAAHGPVHRYTFSNAAGAVADGTLALDSVGVAHATVRGAGATANGTGLRLPGGASASAAYIDLPNGIVSGSARAFPGYAAATYELWVTVHRNLSWSRILDFGSGEAGEVAAPGGTFRGTDYLIVTANVGTAADIRLERGGADFTGGGIQDAAGATTLATRMHLAVTYDGTAWRLYKNGSLLKTLPTLLGPDSLQDVNAWLGRSNWAADSNADATYDEFRIYDYALSDAQVLGNSQAGPDTLTSGSGLNGPALHYPFDESSGITAADASGNGNAGTLLGASAFASGQLGNALFANGTNSGVQTANAITLPNPTAAISIATWMRPTDWSGGNRRIVQKGANNDGYRLYNNGGILRFELANPSREVTAALPALNVWTHVVATYDGATLRLFLNGTEAASAPATGAIAVTGDPLFIGAKSAASPAGERFAGALDDLRLYDRALTAAEIAALGTVVTVTATDPTAQVATSDAGAFIVTRTGPTTAALAVPFIATPGPGSRFSLAPASSVTIPAGQTTAAIALTPTADSAVLGPQTVTLQLGTGAAYALGSSASAAVTLLDSPVNTWKIQRFGSLAAAQSADAADTADADRDGLATLVELAMNRHPITPDPVPVVGRNGSDLTLTFPRLKSLPPGLSAGAVWSDDLATWSAAGVTEQILADDGTTLTVQARIPAGPGGKRFLRLRVTRQ